MNYLFELVNFLTVINYLDTAQKTVTHDQNLTIYDHKGRPGILLLFICEYLHFYMLLLYNMPIL